MTCLEAEVYVSALYDGEGVPAEAAQHIAECGACHKVLSDYSTLGAEMRLTAAVQTEPLPVLSLPAKKSFWQFLRTGVRMPRLAVAGLVACLAVATVAAVVVRAQSRPLWFQFAYGFQKNPQYGYKVAQPGYENGDGLLGMMNGSLAGVDVRIRVESIADDDVALRLRAVPAKLEVSSKGTGIGSADVPVSLAGVPVTHYKPGDDLSVPIEGGGTIYLRGKVFDHQPKIAFGSPLEPEIGEMIMRSPVLTAEGRLIGQTSASASIGNEPGQAIFLRTKEGQFVFALKPFSDAVEGEAQWGRIKFKIGDVAYRLVAAAPITGGDQPVKVWVRRDKPDAYPESVGAGPI